MFDFFFLNKKCLIYLKSKISEKNIHILYLNKSYFLQKKKKIFQHHFDDKF